MERTRDGPLKLSTTTRLNEIAGAIKESRWYSSTPEYHIGHMTGHLTPSALFGIFGVPRFDIEVAALREINVQPVIGKICELLAAPDMVLQQKIEHFSHDPIYTPFLYRAMLVKTLRYIDMQEPKIADINWDNIEALYFPGARHVLLNLEIDSFESSLREAAWKEVLRYETGMPDNDSRVQMPLRPSRNEAESLAA